MMNESFGGKSVLVMGLGRFGGGADTARFACDAGARVIVTDTASAEQLRDSLKQLEDLRGIEFHLGGHIDADFEQADVVVVNPAVPSNNKYVEVARRCGKRITSQMGIFFEMCRSRIIGITGANGKSTTTALTAHLLRGGLGRDGCEYRQVWLGGNIGNEPLLTAAEQMGNDDVVVLEISSFQIEQLAAEGKAPDIALLTNLTPNHLDRYGEFEAYCAAKEHIFRLQRPRRGQTSVSIFNAEDEVGAKWFEKYYRDKGRVCIRFSPEDVGEDIRKQYGLPGRANLANLAGALAIARCCGVDDEAVKTCLPGFKALPHRLELVAEIEGVRWYNDSKATTPEGTMTALDAFDAPEIIIAGGYDKHIGFDTVGAKIARKAKAAILIGQTAQKIADAIRACPDGQAEIHMVGSLGEAAERAQELATAGDVVLLSPACASYDMFENYEQRGREFARLVGQLRKSGRK